MVREGNIKISKINHNEIDLNQISINFCPYHCPYDDCIATDQELCPELKERANIERAKYNTEAKRKDDRALRKISQIINEQGTQRMNDLADLAGLGKGYVQSLKRRGRLEFYKVGYGRGSKIMITGVK